MDNDPGTPVEITLYNQTGTLMTGKDPLMDYTHALQFQTAGNDMVISDFLLKDYPQFIVLVIDTEKYMLTVSAKNHQTSQ